MKSKAVLNEGFRSIVDNGRNYAMVTDLPEAQGGANTGATALEVSLMAFSGCVTTIYKMVATKMRLDIDKVIVDMDAKKGSETIEEVSFKVEVFSSEAEEKLQKCLENTLNTCPVGVLFRKAGVSISYTLEIK
jgi:putative redox protein